MHIRSSLKILSYSYQYLRAGKSYGITFCLAAKSNGSNSSDNFTATLDWDG